MKLVERLAEQVVTFESICLAKRFRFGIRLAGHREAHASTGPRRPGPKQNPRRRWIRRGVRLAGS
jgi:hypothetical protein